MQFFKKYTQLPTFLFPMKNIFPLIPLAGLKYIFKKFSKTVRIINVLAIVITILTTSTTLLYAQGIVEYSAQYQASANGLSAVAYRELIKVNKTSYRLQNTILAEISGQQLAKLEQISELSFINNSFQPLSYSYLLSGITTAAHTINYNWDTRLALSREGEESWTIDLNGVVWDQLSHQFALRQIFANRTTETNSREHEFLLIDGDKIEAHSYTVIGEETLITALGRLKTLKLERFQEESNSRRTIIWLAKDWGYLLARIEQINNSGLSIELDLEHAEINGEKVIALQ
jgi:hypothetical protein